MKLLWYPLGICYVVMAAMLITAVETQTVDSNNCLYQVEKMFTKSTKALNRCQDLHDDAELALKTVDSLTLDIEIWQGEIKHKLDLLIAENKRLRQRMCE